MTPDAATHTHTRPHTYAGSMQRYFLFLFLSENIFKVQDFGQHSVVGKGMCGHERPQMKTKVCVKTGETSA